MKSHVHVSEDDALEYILGNLEFEARDCVRAQMAECGVCTDLVASCAHIGVAAAMEIESPPSVRTMRSSVRATPLAWILPTVMGIAAAILISISIFEMRASGSRSRPHAPRNAVPTAPSLPAAPTDPTKSPAGSAGGQAGLRIDRNRGTNHGEQGDHAKDTPPKNGPERVDEQGPPNGSAARIDDHPR